MGSLCLHKKMLSTLKIIILVMFSLLILAEAGPQILNSTLHNAEAKEYCYSDNECYSWEQCCFDGRCLDSGISCYETNCDLYPSICRTDQELCCNGECWDWNSEECLGLGGLWGIGIAAAVASIVVPVVCCCCCAGGALYWLLRRTKQRRGQVHQPGVHMMQPQGQVHQPGMQMMQGGQPGMQMIQPGSYPTQP